MPERDGPGGPAGPGLRHVIAPNVLDAVIAVAIAAIGLASGFGARAQHEHMPLAALPVLAAMGLVLYPRRRFPAAARTVGTGTTRATAWPWPSACGMPTNRTAAMAPATSAITRRRLP